MSIKNKITISSCCICIILSSLVKNSDEKTDHIFSIENSIAKNFNLDGQFENTSYTVKNGNIVSGTLYDENGKINRIYAYDSSQIKDTTNSEEANIENYEVDTKIDSNENGDTTKITTVNQELKFNRKDNEITNVLLNGEPLFNKELISKTIVQTFANNTKIEREQVSNDKFRLKYGSLNEFDIETKGSMPRTIIDSKGNTTKLAYDDYYSINFQENEFGIVSKEDDLTIDDSFGSKVNVLQTDSSYEITFGDKEYLIEKTEENDKTYYSCNSTKYLSYSSIEENPMHNESDNILGDLEFYTYDDLGYLLYVEREDEKARKYLYDDFGRLFNSYTRTSDRTYDYDNSGNLIHEKSDGKEVTYKFGNEKNKNQLTSVNDEKLFYDDFGNLVSYGEMKFRWDGGQILASASSDRSKCTYEYDVSKLRKRKIVDGYVTEYQYFNGKLMSSKNMYGVTHYIYNDEGSALGFVFNDSLYLYLRDYIGNIKSIIDENFKQVVSYEYDDWGTPTITFYGQSKELMFSNCLVYRDYIYDFELNLYYLGSRYYLPSIRRFICQDDLEKVSNSGSNDYNFNLYSYSNNNPIMLSDGFGYEAIAASISLILFAIGCVAIYVTASFLANLIIKEMSKAYNSYDPKISYYLEKTKNDFSKVVNEAKKAVVLAFGEYAVTIWMWWNNNRHDELHHIIPRNAPQCYEPRRLFTVVYGHKIDDYPNTLYLKFRLHKHLHTNAYYFAVNAYLLSGDRGGGEMLFLKHLEAIYIALKGLNDKLVF